MFSAQALAGSFGEIELTTSEDVAAVREKLREMGYADLGELQRTIETARLTWMPRVMFVLVPLFAGLTALFQRRVGRRYPAHLVFALHVHAAAFVARASGRGRLTRCRRGTMRSPAPPISTRSSTCSSRSGPPTGRRAGVPRSIPSWSVPFTWLRSSSRRLLVVSVAMFGRNWSAAWGS